MWTFWSSGRFSWTCCSYTGWETRSKTVLLERNSQLGGTTTTGGVCFPGLLFHAWGKQVIAGIGWELVAKSVEVDGRKLQDFTKVHRSHVPHHVDINGQLYSPSWPKKPCLDAGVSLAYYQFPEKVVETPEGWLVDVWTRCQLSIAL